MKAGFDSAQAAQNDRSLSLVKLGALSGGTIEPDNLSGVFYLSMPLHNRVDGHEARLYSSRVENLYEINTEQLISEGYLGA